MAPETRKSELIAELSRARNDLFAGVGKLRRDLDFIPRVKAGFDRHRYAWFAAAGLAGLLLARLPARTKKGVVERKERKRRGEEKILEAGLLVTALKFGFDIVRPALTKWLARRVASYAGQRFGRG